MAKIIIEYDQYNDRDDLIIAMNAGDFWNALYDIQQLCENEKKAENKCTHEELLEVILEIIPQAVEEVK